MSSAVSWEHLAELASHLSSAERLRLVERIVHDMAATGETATGGHHRSWSEIRGRVAYPLCGEDAQAWVSRTRSESVRRCDPTIKEVNILVVGDLQV